MCSVWTPNQLALEKGGVARVASGAFGPAEALAGSADFDQNFPMKLPDRIKVDPEIMMGKPCVKDTRIPSKFCCKNWLRAKRKRNF